MLNLIDTYCSASDRNQWASEVVFFESEEDTRQCNETSFSGSKFKAQEMKYRPTKLEFYLIFIWVW